ncbi:Lrp/AsnC family leucine-responsive transcriptional regulator [Sphingomonas sp. UYAg733]
MRNDGEPDATDRRILAALKNNARASATALGQMVNLSRTSVQARIARLERRGDIIGYVAVIRRQDDGATVEAILSLTLGERPCAPVIARFARWPEIVSLYSTAGPIDAVAVVRTGSVAELSRLIDRLSAVAGVQSVQSAIILAEHGSRA